MKTHLKIKIISLAEESKAIRREERKWKKPSFKQYKKDVRAALKLETEINKTRVEDGKEPLYPGELPMSNPKHYRQPAVPPHPMWASLNGHRRGVVRREARHSLLAYGFLRGRAYRAVENKCHEGPDWSKVEDIAVRFGFTDGTISMKALLKTPSPWDAKRAEIKQRLEQWIQEGLAAEKAA